MKQEAAAAENSPRIDRQADTGRRLEGEIQIGHAQIAAALGKTDRRRHTHAVDQGGKRTELDRDLRGRRDRQRAGVRETDRQVKTVDVRDRKIRRHRDEHFAADAARQRKAVARVPAGDQVEALLRRVRREAPPGRSCRPQRDSTAVFPHRLAALRSASAHHLPSPASRQRRCWRRFRLARSEGPPVTPSRVRGLSAVPSALTPRRRFNATLPDGGRTLISNGGCSDTSAPAA